MDAKKKAAALEALRRLSVWDMEIINAALDMAARRLEANRPDGAMTDAETCREIIGKIKDLEKAAYEIL